MMWPLNASSLPTVPSRHTPVYRLVLRAPLERTSTYRMAVSVVPPPQRFDVSLPLTVGPDARPGEGAGDLETKASADEYRFTLTQPQALAVSLQCLSYCAERQIVNEATGAVFTFGYSSKDRTKVLPAGTYRLVVRSSPADAKTGPYGLEVTVIPPAKSFGVQLPFSVADGVPAAGAGNLEARASVDEYRFTMNPEPPSTMRTKASGVQANARAPVACGFTCCAGGREASRTRPRPGPARCV